MISIYRRLPGNAGQSTIFQALHVGPLQRGTDIGRTTVQRALIDSASIFITEGAYQVSIQRYFRRLLWETGRNPIGVGRCWFPRDVPIPCDI